MTDTAGDPRERPRLDPPDLPELTSARFFAALAVMLGHFSHYLDLPQEMWWMLGGYGVSFFFVLSGFILCYRYWDDFAAGVSRRSYRNFFVARVARIYPSYALALALITLLYLVIARLEPGSAVFPENAVTSWLVNLLAIQTFAPSYATQQNWNGPGWSVSTEMFFYLACPFILAALARHARSPRALVLAFAGAAVFGAAMQSATLWLVFKHGWDADFWLDIVASRNIIWLIPEFLAGVVAARLLCGGHLGVLGRKSARNVLLAVSLLSVAALNAAPWPAERDAMLLMRQYRLDLAYMLPFAGVVLALGAGPTFLSPLLSRPAWVFLGNVSYGVYIYHWIGWVAVAHANADGAVVPPGAVAAVVVGIVVFSALSYVTFERPLRKWIRSAFAPRSIVDSRASRQTRGIRRLPMQLPAFLDGTPMPVATGSARRPLSLAPWIGVPFLLYLLLLRHFWFNAPVWDDYDGTLNSVLVLKDAASAREWLGLLLNQHNEHRIALARLVAWTMFTLFGQVDFRALVVIGNLAWLGILVLFCAELRDRLPAPVFAAAALLTLQLSYYEASLLSMAALSNVGAIFFAFACIFFADRDGSASAIAALCLGIVAAGAQASGLFALPVAVAFCATRGRRMRAAGLAVAAAALWIVYFVGYVRPANHPSILAGVTHPLESIHLFLIIAGGIYPGRWVPIAIAAFVFAVLGWSIRRGLWQVSPTTMAWIAYIFVCISATTAGRVGFGTFHASRYAIYSSCLVALALLAAAAVTQPWSRRRAAAAVAACAAASLLITNSSWGWGSLYSFRARLLAKGVPAAADVHADRYFGLLYPNRDWGERILVRAEQRGLWVAREQPILATSVRIGPQPAADVPRAGHLDQILHDGKRLRVVGWSHIPATLAGRTLILAGAGAPVKIGVTLIDRVDVATTTRVASLTYSGFALDVDYASETEARQAAASLCVLSHAPGHEARLLAASPGCPLSSAG